RGARRKGPSPDDAAPRHVPFAPLASPPDDRGPRPLHRRRRRRHRLRGVAAIAALRVPRARPMREPFARVRIRCRGEQTLSGGFSLLPTLPDAEVLVVDETGKERPIDVTSIHWEVSDDGEPSFATLVVPGPE